MTAPAGSHSGSPEPSIGSPAKTPIARPRSRWSGPWLTESWLMESWLMESWLTESWFMDCSWTGRGAELGAKTRRPRARAPGLGFGMPVSAGQRAGGIRRRRAGYRWHVRQTTASPPPAPALFGAGSAVPEHCAEHRIGAVPVRPELDVRAMSQECEAASRRRLERR